MREEFEVKCRNNLYKRIFPKKKQEINNKNEDDKN